MGKGGNNRSWGYASYDVDNEEKEELTYTSYENSGRVNRYTDNGDGGHGHQSWKNSDDYNRGEDADSSRVESNDSSNPTTGEVQENGGCYLTFASWHFLELQDSTALGLGSRNSLSQRTLHKVEGTVASFSDSHDLNYLFSTDFLFW